MYTRLYLKWITNKDLLYSTGDSAQCYAAVWVGGEARGEWIHVHVWLSPFAVHLKLSQHCSSALLQPKKFFKKFKKKITKKISLKPTLCRYLGLWQHLIRDRTSQLYNNIFNIYLLQ